MTRLVVVVVAAAASAAGAEGLPEYGPPTMECPIPGVCLGMPRETLLQSRTGALLRHEIGNLYRLGDKALFLGIETRIDVSITDGVVDAVFLLPSNGKRADEVLAAVVKDWAVDGAESGFRIYRGLGMLATLGHDLRFAPTPGGRLSSGHDEFKAKRFNQLRAAAIPFDDGREMTLDVDWRDGGLSLVFTYQGRDWTYLRCHTLAWLIDGKRTSFPYERIHRDGDVGDGYVLEHVAVTPSRKAAASLLKAKEVRGQLCGDSFRVPPEVIEKLRALPTYKAPWSSR